MMPFQTDIDQIAIKLQRRTPAPRCLQNPVAIERQRRHAGQSAAAGAAIRPGRPTDDADNDRTTRLVLEHGTTGITRAGADSIANTVGYGIDQTNLKRAGL